MNEVRHLIIKDIPQVLKMGRELFGDSALTQDEIMSVLRSSDVVGMVKTDKGDDKVYGFIIYELQKNKLFLLHIGIDKSLTAIERSIIGKSILTKLKDKLTVARRANAVMMVRETQLAVQLLLKENGFLAIKVVENYFADTGEAGYFFKYSPEVVEGK